MRPNPIAILLLLVASLAQAQTGDAILGTWLTTDEDGHRDSVVEIVREGDLYTGLVRWVRYETYPAGDRMTGQPLVDRENPNPELRNRPVLGLPVLQNLRFQNNRWGNGTIYSVRTGKTYRVHLTLPQPDTLKLRGYLGAPLFGQTVYWTRSTIPPAVAEATPPGSE